MCQTPQLTRKVWFFFLYISHWSLVTFFCSPICWILYHVTSSCKGPIALEVSGAATIAVHLIRFSFVYGNTCLYWKMLYKYSNLIVLFSFVSGIVEHRTRQLPRRCFSVWRIRVDTTAVANFIASIQGPASRTFVLHTKGSAIFLTGKDLRMHTRKKSVGRFASSTAANLDLRLKSSCELTLWKSMGDMKVNLIPDRVSFRYDLIPAPYWVSIFVYMIPAKNSFHNEFIPVVALDRNFRSGTKSGRTFHKYHVKEVRAHSGTELGTRIGWADQLTHTYIHTSAFFTQCHSRMRTFV